jgi:predicted transcriptional regulator
MSENIDEELEEQNKDTDNARAGVTLRKYQNQMAWRRNKVRELLARGYHQDEIASTLHISQPTISGDIHYIQKQIHKNSENYGEYLFQVYRNNLQGIDELIKKLWTIVDSPKTNSKEKIKAIALIDQYYSKRLELVRIEPSLIQRTRHMDHVKQSSI